jgi:ABC-type uncharacterized transport system permease subunit
LETLFAIGVGAFGACTAAYLTALWVPRPWLVRLAHVLLAVTVALWTVLLAGWGSHGQLGTRLYLGFSAWALSGLYLLVARKLPLDAMGSVVAALATILAIFAGLVSRRDLTPNAQLSDWLLRSHIGLAFVGLVGLAFASAVSVFYLVQAQMLKRKTGAKLRRRLPPLDVMDRLALRGLLIGFPFYTLALVLGSAEAMRMEDHGGVKAAYVLAGISWLIYGAVLQARLTAGWRGRRAAILTVAGLLLTLTVVAQYSLGLA